jgi:hypothetical protein
MRIYRKDGKDEKKMWGWGDLTAEHAEERGR